MRPPFHSAFPHSSGRTSGRVTVLVLSHLAPAGIQISPKPLPSNDSPFLPLCPYKPVIFNVQTLVSTRQQLCLDCALEAIALDFVARGLAFKNPAPSLDQHP